MSAEPGRIRYEVVDRVARVTIDRPGAYNAFTLDMVDEWADVVRQASADPGVGALVLTGEGRAFCAGGDRGLIDTLGESPVGTKTHLTDHIHHVAYAMQEFSKPSIAAINGVAVGAGLDMTLMCDMRFMSSTARVSEGYVKLGLVPGDGGAYYLPRIVGVSKALEMLLSGDFVDADEALRCNLVSRVYEPDELLDRTHEFAARLARGPSYAQQLIKRAVYQGLQLDLRTALDLISSHMGVVASGDDARSARRAVAEGREPIFGQSS